MKLSRNEKMYLHTEFNKFIEDRENMLDDIPLIHIFNEQFKDYYLSKDEKVVLAQGLLKKAVYYSNGDERFLLQMLEKSAMYRNRLQYTLLHKQYSAVSYMSIQIKGHEGRKGEYLPIPSDIEEAIKTENLRLEAEEQQKEVEALGDEARRKRVLFMLDRQLTNLKEIDFLVHPPILDNMGHCAGYYIASGIIAGHLTESQVLDHFLKIIPVHQIANAHDIFRDILHRGIRSGMKTPATKEMVDYMIYDYGRIRERELQLNGAIPK